ncbi:HEPN domain-containing protein [Hyalangium rubrum]|uniref:HEPN domain-containing protein n=1 Tax=Hyalangium rubrum TaxID=3103134 RepID=A0ABU5H0K3_9BACT|nr:HEPN domain-containing protein [Hyalangium sp. s54d21]MDY7226986.1 HEPN domain-containing protein [Hyalangium sp. s54d21]
MSQQLVEVLRRAVARGTHVPRDFLFVTDLPAYFTEPGNGFSISARHKQIAFDATAESDLESVVSALLQRKPISSRMDDDVVRQVVFRSAAEAADDRLANRESRAEETLKRIERTLAETRPTLIVFPVKGLAWKKRVLRLGPVVIGRVGQRMEEEIDSLLREKHERGFSFSDEVPWAEEYVSQETNKEGYQGALCVAVLSEFRGSLGVADCFAKLDVFFAVLVYLAELSRLDHFQMPEIGREKKGAIRIAGRDDLDFNEEDLFHVSSESGVDTITTATPTLVLDADSLLRKKSARDLCARLVPVVSEARPSESDARMVRFMQWFLRARQSFDGITSVAYYVFALEAILGSSDQHERIAALLAERVAFLMPNGSGVARANLAKKVKQLYATRSKLAHGAVILGARVIGGFAVSDEARSLCVSVAQQFQRVAARQRWSSEQDMAQWFERMKYSGGTRQAAHTRKHD